MKLYISGPMTGKTDFNYPAFYEAAHILRCFGYDVVNPAALEVPEHKEWLDYLRRDIKALMDCDGIALLDGWQNSKGATIESNLGRSLGFRVFPMAYWTKIEIIRKVYIRKVPH